MILIDIVKKGYQFQKGPSAVGWILSLCRSFWLARDDMFLVAMCWSQLHLNKGPLRYLKAVRIPGSESPADCLAFEFFLHTCRNTTWEIQILESMWMDDSVFVSWVLFTFLTSENLAHVSIMQSVYIDHICRTSRYVDSCWSRSQLEGPCSLPWKLLIVSAIQGGFDVDQHRFVIHGCQDWELFHQWFRSLLKSRYFWNVPQTHRIHEWCIYLHLPYKSTKCILFVW